MTGANPEPPPPYGAPQPQQPPAAPYAPPPPQPPQPAAAPYAPPPPEQYPAQQYPAQPYPAQPYPAQQYPAPQHPPGAYPPPPYLQGQGQGQKSNHGVIIVVGSIVVVLALLCVAGIVGAFWYIDSRNDTDPGATGDIAGVIDYRVTHPEWLERDHLADTVTPEYPMVPAAGGKHFGVWQRCAGDVYDKPIIEGRAVHSLEHGAVWITYRPSLARADVDKLAAKVKNNDFMLMSPYDGQPSPISLQAWGYQLRVDKADDPRVDQFIKQYRETASLEPGTPCSNGLAE